MSSTQTPDFKALRRAYYWLAFLTFLLVLVLISLVYGLWYRFDYNWQAIPLEEWGDVAFLVAIWCFLMIYVWKYRKKVKEGKDETP